MERLTQALARTPLHHWHAARGARWVVRDGWQIPASYSEVSREVAAVRTGLGLVDLSALAKISLRGNGVAKIAHALMEVGRAFEPHGVVALDAGGRMLVCCLSEDHLFLLASTPNVAPVRERLATLGLELPIVEWEVSSAYAAFGLLGTFPEKVLRQLKALDLERSAFPAGFCAETSLAGVHALLIRPPELPLDTVLVTVAWDLGEYVWEQLLEAGRGQRMAPVGLDAWQILTSANPNMSLG